MVKKPNILIRFWQELKRRKVFKVLAMYAGTAFIIIQVVDILTAPLDLPPWIETLMIILLSAGFPVITILAWIFDLTPEGIKKTKSIEELVGKEIVQPPTKRRLKVSDVVIFVMAIAIIVLAWPKVFNKNALDNLRSKDGRISLAVMPFKNLTNDTLWDVWEEGIQTDLIYSLSNNPDELSVKQSESVNTLIKSEGLPDLASLTPSVESSVSQKLKAKVFIDGTINRAGSKIRVNARLTNSRTKEIFKSFQIECLANDDKIMSVFDSLSVLIRDYLVVSKIEDEASPDLKVYYTNSPEAFRYFILANQAWSRYDTKASLDFFSKAVAIDTNFVPAIIFLSMRFGELGLHEDEKKWCLKAYEKRDIVPLNERFMAEWYHAQIFGTPTEEVKYLKQIQDLDNQIPVVYWLIGNAYSKMMEYKKAIPEFEEALKIYKKWKIKPMMVPNYTFLGTAYHKTGQLSQERKLYKKALKDFPDDLFIIQQQAVLALTEGDTVSSGQYIKKCITILKDGSWSEADIAELLAATYSEAGVFKKAEEYYTKALSLAPQNPDKMSDLAMFLIDKVQRVDEGLELANKAVVISPDNWEFLDTKGYGLYKQGKYKEALPLLKKSWDLRPNYNHDVFMHLEETRKAIAVQK